jgi:DNA-binding MarR family transcriptional regulator
MRPSDIAVWVNRERHNITTLIDRLSRDGLVKTKRDSKDRRSIKITITNKGRKVLDEAKPVAKEIVNQVMSSISEEDATKLEKLAGVLEQNTQRGIEQDAKFTPPPSE